MRSREWALHKGSMWRSGKRRRRWEILLKALAQVPQLSRNGVNQFSVFVAEFADALQCLGNFLRNSGRSFNQALNERFGHVLGNVFASFVHELGHFIPLRIFLHGLCLTFESALGNRVEFSRPEPRVFFELLVWSILEGLFDPLTGGGSYPLRKGARNLPGLLAVVGGQLVAQEPDRSVGGQAYEHRCSHKHQ